MAPSITTAQLVSLSARSSRYVTAGLPPTLPAGSRPTNTPGLSDSSARRSVSATSASVVGVAPADCVRCSAVASPAGADTRFLRGSLKSDPAGKVHYRATVRMTHAPTPSSGRAPKLDLEPYQGAVYDGHVLFHGARFQVIDDVDFFSRLSNRYAR